MLIFKANLMIYHIKPRDHFFTQKTFITITKIDLVFYIKIFEYMESLQPRRDDKVRQWHLTCVLFTKSLLIVLTMGRLSFKQQLIIEEFHIDELI